MIENNKKKETPRKNPRSRKNWPQSPPPTQQKPSKSMAIWIFVLILFFMAILFFNSNRQKEWPLNYTQFIKQIDKGNIASLKIKGLEVKGTLVNTIPIPVGKGETAIKNFKVILPAEDKDLPDKVWTKNPDAQIEAEFPGSSAWVKTLATALPLLAVLLLWVFLMRQMQAGGNKAFSFGKSKAKMIDAKRPRVTFDDVAGVDEAKEELQEIIEFLKDPKRFQRLGGRIPKGVLLLGRPGTGKTLLARAVAGEAGVPFFSMSGSDFVEMFVGVGASRVRDLFEKGKKHAPCILFIDELDAVGRHRGAGLGGGHDEREQTLNQLLVEMDGFNTNEGVILLAATNRPDVLDPALLRPGRFDRRIVVDMPDLRGRLGILKVHTRKVPLDDDVDLEIIARGTPGMSGADIANMVNEAALLAARRSKDRVTMTEFDEAKDKVLLGPERKSRVLKEDTKRMTAYHEAGHAIVGSFLEHTDPIHKVTIIPRGRAAGLTYFLPDDDRTEYSKDWCLDTISLLMGGRVAEEIVIKRIGSGAYNDIKEASSLARKMVTQWGMSERLGPITYGDHDEQIFLGKEIAVRRDFSEETAREIDNEVKSIVHECYLKTKKIINDHMDQLHTIAEALLEREVLDGNDVKILLNGGELPPFKHEEKTKTEETKKDEPYGQKEPKLEPEGGTETEQLADSGDKEETSEIKNIDKTNGNNSDIADNSNGKKPEDKEKDPDSEEKDET